MIPVLRELKMLMELYGISPARASKLIGCSQATAYNWLAYESSSPGPLHQEAIKKAIREIKREYADEPAPVEIKRYYRALWPKLSRKEKDELFEIVNNSGGILQPVYLQRLKELAAKYKINLREKL